MAILPIIVAPDPRLKVKSTPIDVVSEDIIRLMDDMLDTMYSANGIGLAAIQIGVPKRIIVMDISKEENKKNPMYTDIKLPKNEDYFEKEKNIDLDQFISVILYKNMILKPEKYV